MFSILFPCNRQSTSGALFGIEELRFTLILNFLFYKVTCYNLYYLNRVESTQKKKKKRNPYEYIPWITLKV